MDSQGFVNVNDLLDLLKWKFKINIDENILTKIVNDDEDKLLQFLQNP